MTAINEITGDKIQSKVGDTAAYADSWERTFGKKNKVPPCSSHEECADSWVLGEPATEVKQDTEGCCGECC